MEKRGPVEFNHAISYVNKIKVMLSFLLFGVKKKFYETVALKDGAGQKIGGDFSKTSPLVFLTFSPWTLN